YMILYAQKLVHNAGARVVIFDAAGYVGSNPLLNEKVRTIEQNAPNHISLQSQRTIDRDFLLQHDLMLVSLESWKKLFEAKSIWLPNIPSTLIVSDYHSSADASL
ncbi:MAG: hypothetical protein ACTHMM_04435, partial [Agriterribacter sp.]